MARHRWLRIVLLVTCAWVPLRALRAEPAGDLWTDSDADLEFVNSAPQLAESHLAYKDADALAALLWHHHRAHPEITHLEVIGESAEGRPIWAMKISDHAATEEAEPAIMLNAAHHGLELLPTEFVYDAVVQLLHGYGRDPEITLWVTALEIWCVPLVNPDGREYFLYSGTRFGRKNRRDIDGDGYVGRREGVDLNRNYPFRWGETGGRASSGKTRHRHYRGPWPASEPETQAMMRLASRERFVASISYHTRGTAIMPPYAASGVGAPVGDEAWQVAHAIAAEAPVQSNGRRFQVRHRIRLVEGVEKDWLRFTFGTVALVVEGASHNPRVLEPKRRAVALNRTTWKELLARFVGGPSVIGVVRGQSGEPIEAEVRILEQAPRAGERWTNRPRDGFFARYLPSRDAYTVAVIAPGHKPAYRRILSGNGPARLGIVLEPLEGKLARVRP